MTDSDLSGRIPVEGHDELAQLGHTFNDMVERLDDS
ncbi:MAG: HAMP domain-containing protein, partial [Acidimicrobiia bacterium]|nr:HAMP domain-containing protein [Acidimicrobiia bacterium]